jgi:hypothetical protein
VVVIVINFLVIYIGKELELVLGIRSVVLFFDKVSSTSLSLTFPLFFYPSLFFIINFLNGIKLIDIHLPSLLRLQSSNPLSLSLAHPLTHIVPSYTHDDTTSLPSLSPFSPPSTETLRYLKYICQHDNKDKPRLKPGPRFRPRRRSRARHWRIQLDRGRLDIQQSSY